MSSKIIINKFKKGKINNKQMEGSLELLALNQIHEKGLITDSTYQSIKERIIKEYKIIWNDLLILENRVRIHNRKVDCRIGGNMQVTGVRIDIWTHFMRECIINYVH